MNLIELIEQRLIELEELLKEIPIECKGPSQEAAIYRRKYMKIKFGIRNLIEEINQL